MLSTEEELQRTQLELENLKAEYQEFAYIISHDLSAPFRATGGFAKIIADNNTDLDEKTKKHLNFIIKGADEGSAMVDALLTFSRINTIPQMLVDIDLNTVCTEVTESLDHLIKATNAQIHINELPTMNVDWQQISQVFHQLLKNALMYHESSINTETSPKIDTPPEITISAIEKENHTEFCIKDNGMGIKERDVEKIFKVLRRAVANSEYPGVGMGLAITKKILQHHKGTIWVETEEGVGSAFYFTVAKL